MTLKFYVQINNIDERARFPISLCERHLKKVRSKTGAEWREIGVSHVRCKHCLNDAKRMLRAKAEKNKQVEPAFTDSFYYQLKDVEDGICTRQQAINTIEYLYPADSQFPSTAKDGRKLLEQARGKTNWRNEPDEVLIRYAELCQEKAGK